jgi:hypothetical protein
MAATLKVLITGKKGDFSNPLTGRIVLNGNFEIGPNGERFLSARCLSASELQSEVNSLQRELEKINHTAKSMFSAGHHTES